MAHLATVDDAAWGSPWRARPVGIRVALSLALVLTALVTPAWPGSALVAAVAVALMLGSARIRASLVALVTVPPVVFIAVGVLPLAVQVGGAAVLSWAPDGGARALDVLAHGVAGTLALLLLVTTTTMVDLLAWCRGLRIPAPLLEIAELMYRLVFVLLSTAVALQQAQQARLSADAPFTRRLRYAADATGTVLLRTWDRATRLQHGLALRGYEEDLPTLRPAPGAAGLSVLRDAALVVGIWLAVWAVA
ncbi:cobalt ECF transporter T component CbiQ [Tessaracoccus sp. MC1865]|uniref:cobalt ECF transporter T component CbiQ n=1 Tax=unclassified Tessaracoccus TaxID=2635419 RepID=UPI00160210D0|nr:MULTISPECIES: cobalt ECF transporter T component CbiQ [unclassified Tessaracoccus]MBB1484102.1 cobalt ECF transporter T component CbiQ [Tessaracoccus sp. MC1865]MBB1508385.1 cobalt ECF transporter T component CbiQ [Tessaracoccus sp. MC1756]QTO37131.1 cobalt ECF transporter T component CbiQ [Tessaracoccus sp. MC1865]